jgi:hypothetical protein
MVRQLKFGGGDIYVEIMIMLKASLAVTRQLFGPLQSILDPDNRKPRCLPMNEGFLPRLGGAYCYLMGDCDGIMK